MNILNGLQHFYAKIPCVSNLGGNFTGCNLNTGLASNGQMKYKEDDFYIDRILSGEVAAYASLVEKHKDLVFSIALKVLNNREDAEEVAQDAFVKAYQSLKTFERKSKFSTWLYRIVYNAAVSKTRKKKMEFVAKNESLIQN